MINRRNALIGLGTVAFAPVYPTQSEPQALAYLASDGWYYRNPYDPMFYDYGSDIFGLKSLNLKQRLEWCNKNGLYDGNVFIVSERVLAPKHRLTIN